MNTKTFKTFKTTTPMPEEPELRFETTGPQGGDAGHGGEAVLSMRVPSTCASVLIKSDRGEELLDHTAEGESVIHLSVFGDWELTGLENAILELADAIRAGRGS